MALTMAMLICKLPYSSSQFHESCVL